MVEFERIVQSSNVAIFTLTSLVAVGLLRLDEVFPSLLAFPVSSWAYLGGQVVDMPVSNSSHSEA